MADDLAVISAPPRSRRRAYLQWVEDQVEAFKESIPRDDLLALAEEVIHELRLTDDGQYQLTELLLCDAVDRKITRMLKLPGYRRWCAAHPPEAVPPAEEPVSVLLRVVSTQ